MRKDVAFAGEQFPMSERRACKLVGVDRGSYRYEPRPDRNAELRQELVSWRGRSRATDTGDCMRCWSRRGFRPA